VFRSPALDQTDTYSFTFTKAPAYFSSWLPDGPADLGRSARGTHLYWSVFVASCIFLTTAAANAHGVVGARFFPATIATDDPFAADELALPTITAIAHDTEYDLDYSKTIFPGFAVSLGAGNR